MKRRVKVTELMQREGLSGEVVQLLYPRRSGIIHGDDGYEVTFNAESLVVGLAYSELGIGLRVSYGIFFATGAKFPTAINVGPAPGRRTQATEISENAVSAKAGGSGMQ
jgi:hypothetical protein